MLSCNPIGSTAVDLERKCIQKKSGQEEGITSVVDPPPSMIDDEIRKKAHRKKKSGLSLLSWTTKRKKRKEEQGETRSKNEVVSSQTPASDNSHGIKCNEQEKSQQDKSSRLMKIISSENEQVNLDLRSKNVSSSSSNGGLFFRGYNSLRSSLTRLKISGYSSSNNHNATTTTTSTNNTLEKNKNLEVTLNDIEPLKLTEIGTGSSADSGLGEDSSDLDTNRDSSLITTPTPILVSSLRKVSDSSRSSSSGGSVQRIPSTVVSNSAKKHVIIREPSLSKLPSTSRRNQNRCRVVTTRIYSGPTRLPSIKSTGTVSSVWTQLYQSAYNEVLQRLTFTSPHLNSENNNSSSSSYSIRLIFEIYSDLSSLDSEEIADLIHTVYKILYYIPWRTLESGSLVIHIVQRFLVVLVDYVDLNNVEKNKFSIKFRDLLRTSEMTCYRNTDQVLERTRKVYIEFWCALLTVPFNEPFLIQEKHKLLD